MFEYILTGIGALALGVIATLIVTRIISKARGNGIIDDAKLQAEKIKNEKIIEAKEAEMKIKTEAERQANSRLAKVQQAEAKQKQRELQLNQMQSEVQRKKNENDTFKINLENQQALLDQKKEEIEKLKRNVQDTLEHVAGISAEEAKEKLIESLKDEAKTAAASYINDIMDEAKLTANKEAKRIVFSRFSV